MGNTKGSKVRESSLEACGRAAKEGKYESAACADSRHAVSTLPSPVIPCGLTRAGALTGGLNPVGAAILALSILTLFLIPLSGAESQTLAQLTTAAVASEGEGALFVLAGNDAYRTGVSTRFEFTENSDIGFQGGIERYRRRNFYGGGVDLKLHILSGTSTFPFDLSVGGSAGYLKSGELSKKIFSGIVTMSTKFERSPIIPFEPYVSLNLNLVMYSRKEYNWLLEDSGSLVITDEDCLGCPNSNSFRPTEKEIGVRAGVRFFLSHDLQGFIEGNLNGASLIGGGLNLVF